MSWQTVKLGDKCEVKRGTTITEKQAQVGDVPVVAGGLTYSYTHNAANREGNVITVSGSGANAGYVNFWKQPIFASDCSTIQSFSESVDIKFVFYFLKSKQQYINSTLRSGAAQPHVYAKDIAQMMMPLPPLAEQKRIAAILDKATEIKAKREQAIAKLEELVQSTFLEMFGNPVNNEKGWKSVSLGSVTSKLGSGATPSGGDASYKAEGIPLIRSLNVHDGEFVYKNLAHIDDEQAEKLSNVVVEKDDVLLNITGASVARVCRVPDDVVPARVNQHVMIVRATNKINPIFLERQLLSAYMKQKLLKIGGAGATREAITKAQAVELNVICPPINEQEKYVAVASLVEKLKAKEIAGLASLEKTAASLQHQAFTTGFKA